MAKLLLANNWWQLVCSVSCSMRHAAHLRRRSLRQSFAPLPMANSWIKWLVKRALTDGRVLKLELLPQIWQNYQNKHLALRRIVCSSLWWVAWHLLLLLELAGGAPTYRELELPACWLISYFHSKFEKERKPLCVLHGIILYRGNHFTFAQAVFQQDNISAQEKVRINPACWSGRHVRSGVFIRQSSENDTGIQASVCKSLQHARHTAVSKRKQWKLLAHAGSQLMFYFKIVGLKSSMAPSAFLPDVLLLQLETWEIGDRGVSLFVSLWRIGDALCCCNQNCGLLGAHFALDFISSLVRWWMDGIVIF